MYKYILNIVILESCSILIDSLLFGEGGGGCLKLDVQGQGGWKIFGRRWTRGVGGLENRTIFMDVICVSPLMHHNLSNSDHKKKVTDVANRMTLHCN